MPLWLSRKKCHYICCKTCFCMGFSLTILIVIFLTPAHYYCDGCYHCLLMASSFLSLLSSPIRPFESHCNRVATPRQHQSPRLFISLMAPWGSPIPLLRVSLACLPCTEPPLQSLLPLALCAAPGFLHCFFAWPGGCTSGRPTIVNQPRQAIGQLAGQLAGTWSMAKTIN